MNEIFHTMKLDRMSEYLSDLAEELVTHDPTLSAMAAMLSNVANHIDELEKMK